MGNNLQILKTFLIVVKLFYTAMGFMKLIMMNFASYGEDELPFVLRRCKHVNIHIFTKFQQNESNHEVKHQIQHYKYIP
jgi:hypothetical protein